MNKAYRMGGAFIVSLLGICIWGKVFGQSAECRTGEDAFGTQALSAVCSGTNVTPVNLRDWLTPQSNNESSTGAFSLSKDGVEKPITNPTAFTAAGENVMPGGYTLTYTPAQAGADGKKLCGRRPLTVNTKPDLNGISPSTVCAGLTTLEFRMSNITGTPSDFSYTGGGTAGLAAGPASNVPNPTTLLNDTGADITVNLRGVTVKYAVGTTADQACVSDPRDITFTVRYTPKITIPTPPPGVKTAADGINFAISLCKGEDFPALTFSSNPAAVSYGWSNDMVVGGTASGTTSRIPAFKVTNANTDGTDKTGVITLNATPSAGCSGSAKLTVTVHPSPVVTVIPPETTVCDGATSQAIRFSAVPGDCTFSWNNDSYALSPDAGGGYDQNGSGNMNSAPARNGTGEPMYVYFTAIGVKNYPATSTSDSNNCQGTQGYLIVVNPSPTATVAATKTVCSGQPVGVEISSNSKNVDGTQYTWTSTRTDLGAKDNVSPSLGPINDVLSLPGGTTVQDNAVYEITPIANNCKGDVVTTTLRISPLPVATTNAASLALCDNETTHITLGNTFNDNAIKYIWTVVQNGTSEARNSTSQVAPGNDGPIEDQLRLTGVTGGTVDYLVKAVAGTCISAQSTTQTITVRGKPVLKKDLSNLVYCDGKSITLSIESAVPANNTYRWYLLSGTSPLTDIAPYSGTSTQQLTINDTPDSFSGNQYQVEITDRRCPNATSRSLVAIITSQFHGREARANKTSLSYGEKVVFTLLNVPEEAEVRWEFGDTWYSEEKNPAHYYYTKGTFLPKVTLDVKATLCHHELELPAITVSGDATDGDIITGDKASRELAVYPIPAQDKLTVKSEGNSSVALYNAQGQWQLGEEGIGVIEITIANQPQGIYILKVSNSAGIHFVKIIKGQAP